MTSQEIDLVVRLAGMTLADLRKLATSTAAKSKDRQVEFSGWSKEEVIRRLLNRHNEGTKF